MKLRKSLLAAASTMVLLAAFVSTASANRLSSNAVRTTAIWREVIFRGPFGEANCNLTLEGSVHSATITKTPGLLIGYITRASIERCVVGGATVLQETLPWHVRYRGFTGTLPNISSIITEVIGAGFRIRETNGVLCLSLTSVEEPGIGTYNREARGVVTSVTQGGEIRTSCLGVRGSLSGTSTSYKSETGGTVLSTLI